MEDMFMLYLNPSLVKAKYNCLVKESNPPTVPLFSMDDLWSIFEYAIEMMNRVEDNMSEYSFYQKYIAPEYATEMAETFWCSLIGEAVLVWNCTIPPPYRLRTPDTVRQKEGIFHLYWYPVDNDR